MACDRFLYWQEGRRPTHKQLMMIIEDFFSTEMKTYYGTQYYLRSTTQAPFWSTDLNKAMTGPEDLMQMYAKRFNGKAVPVEVTKVVNRV